MTQFDCTAAKRRYARRMLPLMAGYAVLILGAAWAQKTYHPQGAALLLLALLPALPLLGAIATMGLYLVEERDEYLRERLARAMLAGLGFMLAVTTVWGFLEEAGQVPHMPTYFAFVLWCAGMGAAQCLFAWRARGEIA